jgi:hypothetical protein
MSLFIALVLLLSCLSMAGAHVQMTDPPPFRSESNPYTGQDIDYDMTAPISAQKYPCKGYYKLIRTPEGQSVAAWTAGESYTMTLAGSATHGGGSYQVSLSFDQGQSFTVIHS